MSMMNTTQSGTAVAADAQKFSWKRLCAVVFLLLPVLVSVIYMWAMYDPTKKLRDVRLAVVNEDAGAEINGEHSVFGDNVVAGLLKREYLSFEEVSSEDAERGLHDGTYMFTVVIPKDFSANVGTLFADEPIKPEIAINYNDYNGTNGSILTGGLVPKIQTAVSSSISESYAKKLIGGVNKLGDGLGRAAEGSTKLDDGAGRLNAGLAQGLSGANQLNDGAQQLAEGSTRLASGTQQLSDGAGRLAAGTEKLGDGAQQISAGVDQLTGTLIPLLSSAQQAAPQLHQAVEALRLAGMNEQAQKLDELATKLDANNPNNQVAQLNKLKDGTATLAYMLSDPTSEYYGGILKLQDGINRANEGAAKLSDGAGRLADGTHRLASGTQQLYDGSGQLKGGTGELSSALSDGASQAPHARNLEASAKQVAVPIVYKENNVNPVQTVVDASDPTVKNLGSGASMLIIMVFGFLLMALIAMLVPTIFGTGAHGSFITPTLKSFAGLFVFGLIALGVLSIVAVSVGWSPKNWLAIILSYIGMSAAAAASNQMLRVVFGQFIGGIAILAVFAFGMFSFGGVWPLATVPKVFQLIHPITPMTAARQAFIDASQGNVSGHFVASLAALFFCAAVCLGITLIVRARRAGKYKPEAQEAGMHAALA
ncbi:YhgE/Pip domain-containing protein [Corynebacterium kutscheri]|uniref:Integral membrane protein n=1 Tax=Corynebacterium kutscheri TaxID=35755 RepID=A0AB38VVU3_9CORY|nr:YhgE/Pip domain-containing protein [Corynebacterium kutscheri]VEH05748.1 integral membrane protein [Corynebacterium kutscheri]